MDEMMFRRKIYNHFSLHKRTLPWRYETDPYKILVSEVMLQQTQVSRVIPKYKEWLEKFPTVELLAQASLRDVLVVWQGLGYNRRGKYLKEAAEKIVSDKRYSFLLCHPRVNGDPDYIDSRFRGNDMVLLLEELSGIGHATAAAIVAYAFNKPVVFIETNIRAVYLYFFFKKDSHISDSQIADLVEKTLDYDNPRDWYYALTDYGNMLKTREKFKNTQSKHYTKQSKFEGSRRQVRGFILRELSNHSSIEEKELRMKLEQFTQESENILEDLTREGIIYKRGTSYAIR